MTRARKVCSAIGCPNLSLPGGRLCVIHTKGERQASRERRTPTPSLYNAEWRRLSKAFLEEHPYCACGCGGKATIVDHIRPHRGDLGLFWDQSNWQGMTKKHHDAKTAREDGGGGNARRSEREPTLAKGLATRGKAQRNGREVD